MDEKDEVLEQQIKNLHQHSNSQTSLQQQNIQVQPSSPRRRKPPLDLDAALYIQSQAACVQEPNKCSTSSGSSNTLISNTGSTNTNLSSASNSNIINLTTNNLSHQQPATIIGPANVVNLKQSSTSLQAYTSTIRPYNHFECFSYNNNNNSQQHQRNFSYPNYYYRQSNEISVDYIDCVSNNDLTTNQIGGNMRAIPHCKKHLRFHRNRIDPTTNASDDKTQTTDNNDNNNNDATSSSTSDRVNDPKTPLGAYTIEANNSLNETSSVATNSDDLQATDLSSKPGVLYPISVNDVKKRTYFVDSLNQDALLGSDELHRYFPNGRVNIFISTWNQNRKRSPPNLNDLLLPDQLINMPDIYAIAIQEAFSYQAEYLKEWEIELQTTLGPNHVLLHSCCLGVLHLALFVRRDLIWFCSTPEESVYNSRSMPTNMIKTKGAVSIAFRFFGTSFMFTNCHFPAHENRLKDRIDEYQRIIKSIDLPKNLKLLKPRYLSNDSTARFDCVFFLGDLNFRLEQRTFDETINIIEDIFQQKEPSYEALTQNDELIKVMESGQAFHGFDESAIKFPPTYKFLAQTNKYDKQSKRVPSYTDRILFRSKRQRHIQCLLYDWLPQLLSSDHKPVFSLFNVLIRPGSQMNMVKTLNAGLFQRSVYIEALKRRAEDPDSLLVKDTGGNVICCIS